MFAQQKKYLILIAATTVVATAVLADQPSVTAVLSRSQTVVGRPVELQIKITGSPSAKPPDSISVDGLDIRYNGQSQMIEGRNLQFSYSFVYSYSVLPERPGTFIIPSQRIQAGSNSLRTSELTLNVGNSGTNQGLRGSRGTQSFDTQKLAMAELVIPHKTAYVGEMIPVELRVCFNSRTPAGPFTDPPEITGQGFTIQKLSKPTETSDTIDGQTYDVLTFKTAICPVRPGRLEIGPIHAKAIVTVPRRPSSGGNRSPFDIFDLDDPFSDPFFSNPFGSLMERREIQIESKSVTLEVKSLPPNAPSDFSGAIGMFTMETEAKPKSVQIGDPIAVTTKISGRGNFDRITAPSFENDQGWHQYPPSAKFQQDDDVGISGAKTFETVLTPNEQKKQVPPVVFSYFDPLMEKYFTLRSNAIPVPVEGGAAPTPAPTVASQVPTKSASQTGSPTPASTKAEDILYQITNWPGTTQSFVPTFRQSTFWMAQIVPLVALLGFVGWKIRQRRLNDREAQRRANLQHEAAELQKRLRRTDVSSQEYYAEAARTVQLKTALAKNINPNTVDAETAAAAFQLDESIRRQLETLFNQKDELRYSGKRNVGDAVSPEERRDVLELMEHFRV